MANDFTRKWINLSVFGKRKICEVHKAHPGLKDEDPATYMMDQHRFDLVDGTTINKILCAKEKWLNVDTNLRGGNVQRAWVEQWAQLLEFFLVLWFGHVRARRLGELWLRMSLCIRLMNWKVSFGISGTDFKLSHGWLHKFKTWHGIKCCYLHGESGDAHALAMTNILFMLKRCDLEESFSFDETCLYNRASPCKTLNIGKA